MLNPTLTMEVKIDIYYINKDSSLLEVGTTLTYINAKLVLDISCTVIDNIYE